MNLPIQALARSGYASRGLIYVVVGSLTIMAAAGMGGETTDAQGALREVFAQPFGRILVALLVVGLVGFAVWRAIQGVTDADHQGTSPKGLLIRLGHLMSAVVHGFLAYWAAQLVMISGNPDNGGGQGESFLATTTGQVLIGIAGGIVIGIGLAHLFKGWTARFERYMQIPPQHEAWARPLCRFGLMARGVVWCVLGFALIQSAIRLNASGAEGTKQALEVIAGLPFGNWLLPLAAAGLLAFGLYSCLEAVYRRVE